MKTLWDRLLPSIKKSLNDKQEDYPRVVKPLILRLKNKYFWVDLTLIDYCDIFNYAEETDFKFPSEIFLTHEDV